MVNNGATPHHISIVNPLAQLIIVPYMAAKFQEVPRLSSTSRGVMTFERPLPQSISSAPPLASLDPHVVARGVPPPGGSFAPHIVTNGPPGGNRSPSGPQSPLMSQLSLYGGLYPRYN